MQPSPLRGVLGTLRRLAGPGGANDLSDADLLERFRARHEEAAFTLLVERHGPMVLGVCRRVLGNVHDAEEAFQATFLVFVRRASAIRKQASLASWLYGVAYRVAAKARARAAARRARERQAVTARPASGPPDALADLELRAALDEEVRRLPEKYRVPLVLCSLEGKTHEQAAQELRWPKSSVTARLGRARDLLRRRLVGRGFAVTAAVLAALVAEQAATAAVPAVLTLATVRLALETLTGKAAATAPAVVLADHVLKGTAMTRLGATLALLLTLGLAGAGLALLTPPQPAVPDVPGGANDSKPDPAANRPGNALPEGALARLGSGRLRHGAPVSDLAFSPDGKRLVSAGTGRLRVWDAATGRLEHRFSVGGDSPVVAFSASGALLTSDSTPQEDGCRLLDVARGAERRRVALRASPAWPTTMAVSAGGRLVAVAELEDVRLFDPASAKETLHLDVTGLIGPLRLALSPDGKAIAVGDDFSGVIRVHDTAAGKRVAELKAEGSGKLAHLTFSPDGRSLAAVTGLGSGTVIVWDVGTGKERYRLPGLAYSGTCVFSPDGKVLAASGSPRDLNLWDASDGKEVRRLALGTWVTAAAFTPDGKTLAAATEQGALVLWDVDSGKSLPQSVDSVEPVWQLQFAEGGGRLVGAAGDVIAWDPATGREVRRIPNAGVDLLGAVSPGGKLLAATQLLGTIAIRDVSTGETLRTLPGHGFMAPDLTRFTPDERRLVTASEDDRAVLVWNLADGEVIHRLTGPDGFVSSLAVSGDGRWLATCSSHPPPGERDDVLCLWDLHTGREVKRLAHQLRAVRDLAFSPDGSRLAAGGVEVQHSPPGRVQVWDVSTGKELLTIDTRTDSVMRVAFSPDGRTLATGGKDAAVRLWELATGEERQRFGGHESEIIALTFAPDGRSLAAASADAPVLVWDVAGTSGPRRRLSAEDLRRCWDDLAGDAAAAFRATRRLASDPDQALPFLRQRLGPVPAADPGRVRQLVDALDSDQFARRQKAAAELAELADRAADDLRREARQASSAEVRRTLGEILENLDATVTGKPRRSVRAVEAAEAMGTPEAARWLDELAGGAPGARLTREAGAARDRLLRARP
jgi:RNA polymerase sigma factor (sigma-70 family)